MEIYKADTSHWYIGRFTHLLAGSITISMVVIWCLYRSEWALVVVALIAAAQVVYASTGYCGSAILMNMLGVPRK